ncbi:MAG: HD domain-containing protein [Actinomycetota bacterium]|nr:HD domain-containing protein [Actinomycetota bacterium]
MQTQLLPAELALWQRLAVQDRRHSLLVARRFCTLAPEAGREEVAGALLHDVGKRDCGMGTWVRVVATVVGPRTARFRRYHDHERLGAELLRAAGSAPLTIELVLGRGPAAPLLLAADDV